MRLAMIGLGRMGGNIARRLMRAGHELVVYDRDAAAVAELAGEGATGVASLARTDLSAQGLPLTVSASFAWRSKRASSITYSTASLPSAWAIMLP